ncbi:MAG: tRNA lysidine(34) synthetase TilS [Bacteroidales bacterium]|nr:tRNA lysidine(34) synthetase TilS [Candidatus Liminaster caballi]
MEAPDIIIVALSGGSDSVVLLHYLLTHHTPFVAKNTRIIAAHCNFHLRGEESMRDERFCHELCNKLGVEIIVKDFDTRRYMADQHMSLEMAARQLRYDWWDSLAKEYEAQGLKVNIAVGHHRDDSIETFLFHIMRGTGIKGLKGIPSSNGRIIRPLIHLSRKDILEYVEHHGLSYVTDSTNMENDVIRNKIRNELIPYMENLNPNARKGIYETILHLQMTDRLADERLDEIFADTQHVNIGGIEWDEWQIKSDEYDFSELDSLFFYWSKRYEKRSADMDDNKSQRAHMNDRYFYTMPKIEALLTAPCPITQTILDVPESGIDIMGMKNKETGCVCELFDADKVKMPLIFRHWIEKDRIKPLGMKNSKLVSDLFTNAHYTPARKSATWIVTDASGRIIWVAPLRIADWCKVTEETKRVLKLGWAKGNE